MTVISAFGSANPHAVFPAVALGWVFTSEKFMEKTSDWLNCMVNCAFLGDRTVTVILGQYEALAQLNSGAYTHVDPNGNVYLTSQVYINRMPNSSLKWERTASYNIGLDFSLFGDKLSGSMETYMAESNDLLVNRSLPSILGYASVMANLGALTNRGFELSLNANLINRDNFSWNSTGTFLF
ncbi:MAG: TonB-dependent receptor domain-containing protein [Parabacteroides merdae]